MKDLESLNAYTLKKMIQALLRGDTFKYCLIHLNKAITKHGVCIFCSLVSLYFVLDKHKLI